MEDLEFKTDPALVSNLERLFAEQSIISEQRILEICDVASALADVIAPLIADGMGVYESLSLVADGVDLGEYNRSELTTEENARTVESTLGALSRLDRATLADLLIDELAERKIPLGESDFLDEGRGSETFTYVKNAFSDEAYDVFSQDFDDPRLKYSSTFKECADMVSDGSVTYCLLPLEERGGARLHTVSELIFRRDFKINSVTPVFGPDGNADMKYALVSSGFTVPAAKAGDDRYLEIRLGVREGIALSELLLAVDHFSMSVYRVSTVVFDTEGESDAYYSLVIRDGGFGFTKLLAYLALFGGDFVPVGIYKNLE